MMTTHKVLTVKSSVQLLFVLLLSAATNLAVEVLYVHTDHLGTPRMMTNEQGVTVWRNLPTSEPFGNSPVEEDPDGDGITTTLNLRFPGQYYDRETNTHYNYFRDYDPSIGRYVQSDPIGLKGGVNTYTYVNGNPVSLTDPTGEVAPILLWGLGAAYTFYSGTNLANNVFTASANAQATALESQRALLANRVCQEQKSESACSCVAQSDNMLLQGSASILPPASNLPGTLTSGRRP